MGREIPAPGPSNKINSAGNRVKIRQILGEGGLTTQIPLFKLALVTLLPMGSSRA